MTTNTSNTVGNIVGYGGGGGSGSVISHNIAYTNNTNTTGIQMLNGDVYFEYGDTLEDRFRRLEQAANVPTRNFRMERKYPHLANISDRCSYEHEELKCKAIERLKQ